jgi:hypothetical protein
VQREIETTEATLRTLENQIAYSTVTVQLREERPEPEPEQNWYDTGVVAAFLESVDGAIIAFRALIVGLAYVLPYLLVFGIPAFGVVAVGRRLSGGGVPLLDRIRSEPGEGEPPADDDTDDDERTGLDVNEREE